MSTNILHSASNRPLAKVLFLTSIIIFAMWIASFFPSLVLTLILSMLTAFILKPIVVAIELKFGWSKRISVAILFLFLIAIVTLCAIFLIPFAIEKFKIFYYSIKDFPFEQKLNEAALKFSSGIPFITPEIVTQKVKESYSVALQGAKEVFVYATEFLVNLVIIPFITYFILAEGDDAVKKAIERVPNKYFEMTLNVINKIQIQLVGYLRGWLLDSAIVGVLNIVAYYAIGVHYAILLGIIAGISNLIPYVGPFFGVVPAILVSLSQYGDFRDIVWILLIPLFGVQFIDNIIIQPYCFSKTVDMHPVLIIIVLIIGNEMMGIAGMLLAIPIATILIASASETYWGLKKYSITA